MLYMSFMVTDADGVVFASLPFSVRHGIRSEFRGSFGPDAFAGQGETAVWKSNCHQF